MSAVPKKSIVELLTELGMILDPDTLRVLEILEKKDSVSEDVIAEKLKIKVNAARKLLYALHTKGITAYTKQRDPKKKWWYLYYWGIDRVRLQAVVVEYKKKLLENKQKELETEKQFAFECAACTEKYAYEDALESEFTCPKCGSLLAEARPTKTIMRLEREIAILDKQIKETPLPKPKPVVEDESEEEEKPKAKTQAKKPALKKAPQKKPAKSSKPKKKKK